MSFQMVSEEVLLKHILALPVLSLTEICNFSQTCKFFNQVIENNLNWLWKLKFKQRWPRVAKQLENEEIRKWFTKVKNQFNIEKQIKIFVGHMANDSTNTGLPSIDSMTIPVDPDMAISPDMLEDSILNIAYSSEKTKSSLTEIFYAKYVLRLLRCAQFKEELHLYLQNQSKAEQSKGAFLVSQWEFLMEENVPKWKNVSETLDNLQMHVQRWLQQKITSTAYVVYKGSNYEQQEYAKVSAIMHTIFQDWNFKADNVSNAEKTNWTQLINAYYIGEVLQKRVGKPIIIAIIVQEMLNRFNLRSDLLADNGQFCFKIDLAENRRETHPGRGWLFFDLHNPTLLPQLPPNSKFELVRDPVFWEIVIPLYNILNEPEYTKYVHPNALQAIPKQKLVQLELNFMRFAWLWNSPWISVNTYAHKCIQHKMHMFEAKDLLEATSMSTKYIDYMIDSTFIDASMPKKRKEIVLYAVGMNVVLETSPQDHSKSLGVITDWAERSTKQFWNCKFKDIFLPCYCVILENGDMKYVSQGQIIEVNFNPKIIDDDKIGIHFSDFNGSYYVGNKGKKKSYPEDEEYKAKLYNI